MSFVTDNMAHAREQRKWIAPFGFAILAALAVTAAAHQFLAFYPQGQSNPAAALRAPGPGHPFGTDALGRDMLSETLHALAVSMSDASIGFAVALIAGMMLGFVCGHMLGRFASVTRVAAGTLASIPTLLLAILISAGLDHTHTALAVGLAAAPATFVRAYDRARSFLRETTSDFAHAGSEPWTLLRRDLTYELHETLVMTSARAFAAVTITLATMSFFGFGAEPPLRDLGLMIASARESLPAAWWTASAPVVTLVLMILAARLAAGLAEGERA